jgi:uncharacterized protein
MRSKVLNADRERTFALIFDIADEVMTGLSRFAEEQNLSASRFTAIGAFTDVVLGYFDWEKKKSRRPRWALPFITHQRQGKSGGPCAL